MKKTVPDATHQKLPFSGSRVVRLHYPCQSITSDGRQTHIRAKQQRFENGVFENEEYEATVDGNSYENAVEQMNQRFERRLSSLFDPFSGRSSDDDARVGRSQALKSAADHSSRRIGLEISIKI